MLGLYAPIHIEEGGNLLRVTFTGGLKLPTGSYSKLKEDHGEDHSDNEMMKENPAHNHNSMDSDEQMQTKTSFRHGSVDHGVVSGVHGHGLAFGTGSWDLLAGSNFFARYGNWLTAGSVQYTFRNSGPLSYRYGDDFLWDVGFGRYLFLEESKSVVLRFNLLGEVKGFDTMRGQDVRDSGLTSLFMGPEINFTAGNNVFGLLALDIPTIMNNTEVGLVAEYRVRLSVMYRF